MPTYDRTQLLRLLDHALNDDEARSLVFDLADSDPDLKWENLAGGTKIEKLYSLLVYYDERGRAPDLIQAARAARSGALPRDVTYAPSRADIEARLRQTPDLDRRNRLSLLLNVWDTWIEGVLRRSVHDAARIALGLEHRPEAVAPRPWDVTVQTARQATQPLSPGQRIVDVFDDCGGSLLILGAPGAGKTTTLLELAHDLILRAVDHPDYPIPTVFNLSSWAQQRLPLAEWMVDRLRRQYNAGTAVARSLVDGNKVLPLLDGLDEVQAEHRAACRDAINTFREERGMMPLALCSRAAEYAMLTATPAKDDEGPSRRLALGGAVFIQPLREAQVDTYLVEAGPPLAALRQAVQADADLRELAQSPLMLSVMSLAYQNTALEQIAMAPADGGGPVRRQRQLFDAYVDAMFTREMAKASVQQSAEVYPRDKTMCWLTWLAQSMRAHGQMSFYLEGLQPDWLPSGASRLQYTMLDRLGWGLVFGLAFGLVVGLVYRLDVGLVDGLDIGLVAGLFYGMVVGMVVGLFGGKLRRITDVSGSTRWMIRDALVGMLVGSVLVGLVGGVLGSVVGGMLGGVLVLALSGGAIGVLIGGLIGGLVGGLAGSPGVKPRAVAVVETLMWSTRVATRRAAAGLVVGLVAGLFFGLVFQMVVELVSSHGLGEWLRPTRLLGPSGGLANVVVYGLVVGLTGGLILGLLGGLVGERVEVRADPNQGIRRSIRSAGVASIIGGLVGGLVGELIYTPTYGQFDGLTFGLVYGLVGGLVGGLAFGGYAVLSHYSLRFVLWRRGAMPWRVVRFLDYADRLIFLRRVGGGYIFMHRSLMEYFASLGESGTTDLRHE